jgi:hypothetical protein
MAGLLLPRRALTQRARLCACRELLEGGVKGLVRDVDAVLPYLQTMSVGSE